MTSKQCAVERNAAANNSDKLLGRITAAIIVEITTDERIGIVDDY